MTLQETLFNRFGITEDQTKILILQFKDEVINKALEWTKHDTKEAFKMNLMIAQKYYKSK